MTFKAGQTLPIEDKRVIGGKKFIVLSQSIANILNKTVDENIDRGPFSKDQALEIIIKRDGDNYTSEINK